MALKNPWLTDIFFTLIFCHYNYVHVFKNLLNNFLGFFLRLFVFGGRFVYKRRVVPQDIYKDNLE